MLEEDVLAPTGFLERSLSSLVETIESVGR